MQYPNNIRPVDCVRCGMPDLVYLVSKAQGFDKGSNSLVIPVQCMNPECKIVFYEHYKFTNWEPMLDKKNN